MKIFITMLGEENETAWLKYLPTIQFALNSTKNSTTKFMLLELLYTLLPNRIGDVFINDIIMASTAKDRTDDF